MATLMFSKGMKLLAERRHLRQTMDMAISSSIASSSPPPISFKTIPSSTHTGSYLLSHSCVKPPTLIIILLLTTLFLLAFFSFYLKRCYAYRDSARSVPFRHLRRTTNSSLFGSSNPLLPHSSTLPQGLDTKVLQTFPKLIFSSSSLEERNMKMPTECVICLEEFEEEETLRLLPPCGHVFHPGCIHMWLFTHTSCPLCRHSLLDNPASPQHVDGLALQTQPSTPLRHDSLAEEAPAN